MKTKMYFVTMLAIIIQGMVKSQTPINQAFQHNVNFVLGYTHYTEEEKREFSNADDPSELLIKADDFNECAQKLKKQAAIKKGTERDKLLSAAEEAFHKSEVRQLAASELTGYNNKMEFKFIKASFVESLSDYYSNDSTTIKAKRLLLEAVRAYRIASELREEAYAQRTNEAILANLHLAEGKETAALAKLVEGLKVIENTPPAIIAKR